MNRRRGILWLAAGLILALLAAGISFFAFQQAVNQQASAVEEEPTQTVIVSAQLINERAVIRLADITTEERPVEEVPSGAIFKTDEAVGRIATRSILPGQVLLAQHLAEESFSATGFEPSEVVTGTVNFSEALGEDLVAYALPANSLLSQEGILLPGDHVDLLFSTDVVGAAEGSGGKVAVYALQDLEVLQIIYQPPPETDEEKKEQAPAEPPPRVPKTIILAIDPQDATVLKYAIDIQAPIDLALRAEDNQNIFEVDAVTINTISERYSFDAPRPLP